MVIFGLSKLVGLLRARFVAQAFGTSPAYDAFTAANQLPELFFAVIAGGSLAAALIPVYSEYLSRESHEKAVRLANTILTLVLMVLGSVSILGMILAPWLTRHILVPSFPPEQQALTAQIMRVILIQTTIFGFSGAIGSLSNAHQKFIIPALAPLALDLGYFAGLAFLVPRIGIMGLAWGTVLGGLFHVAIQLPSLYRFNDGFRPMLDLRLHGVVEIIRLMGPRIVTLGVIQFADLFVIRLASGLASGTTSGYFYAYSLMQLPQTLFGTAIALVLFPTLAELYNAGDREGLKRAAATTLGIIWTLTIPAAVATVLLGEPVIKVLLQGGAFDARSTQLVYTVLVFFSFRIVTESTLEIVARLLYAQHDTRTPMWAYLGWLVVTVALAFLLVGPLGVAGLALATTVGFTLLATALYIINSRRLGGLGEAYLARAAAIALVGAAAMAAVITVAGRFISDTLPFLLVAASAGAAVYLAVLFILDRAQFSLLRSLLRRPTPPPSLD